MSGYLSASKSFSVTDWYNNNWTTISVSVTVASDGTITYSVSSTNSGGGGAWKNVGLYLAINGELEYNGYYTTQPFPAKHGSSAGPYTLTSKASNSSVTVDLRVCCMQDGNVGTRWTDGTATTYTTPITRKYWSDIGTGSISCTDNYNNSFTIKAMAGASGTNNAVPFSELWIAQYKNSDGSWMWGSSSRTLTQTIPLGGLTADPTRPVAAWIRTHATYGSFTDYNNSYTIKQYREPIFPADVSFTLGKTRNRLTIKEPWVFSWTEANAKNTTSPVKGYRIRLYKNDVEIPIKNSAGQVISLTDSVYGGHPYDTDSSTPSFTVYPDKQGFEVGDTVSILVHAYTRYGANNERTGETNCLFSSYIMSDSYEVQNAGIVQVRTTSGWHEGQVWVRSASGWHEAETVQIRAASGWKESE